MESIDVAVIGGGPAGLQAALVLARTRKNVVVFDAPSPPRNGASHGVHNFVGLDGMLPQEIRDQAWQQIDAYESTRLVRAEVTAITRSDDLGLIVAADGVTMQARHVVLTTGYRDVHPDIDGFRECWATSIIPCPFCDGFENRDRRWAIVPSMSHELDVFPAMVQNWTTDRVVIAPRHLEITDEQRAALAALDVDLHVGDIESIEHVDGFVRSVMLDSGERIEVETLLFTPDEAAVPLVEQLVDELGLELDDHGYVKADELQPTNVANLAVAA